MVVATGVKATVRIVDGMCVRIDGLDCSDPDVVAFLADTREDLREELVRKALYLGVVGLKAMGVAGQAAVVEREFDKLTRGFHAALTGIEQRLTERVEQTFDPDKAGSVSARLSEAVADAHDGAGALIASARADLEALVNDSFNPDLATSCVAKITRLVSETRADLDRAFDPRYEDSYLSRLNALVEAYFGDSGAIADVLAAQMAPIKDELLKALGEVRDLLVGQAAAAEARRLSSASGADFEDEVEEVLRRIARPYGDTVTGVGTTSGDGGSSKKGDFVVELAEDQSFVVESKDLSQPVTLKGSKGMLALLDQAMENRGAAFAIGVMKDPCGFPKEVGLFNDYDGDKVLCCFGRDGELLETAYRWARTALLACDGARSIDVETVESGLDEARAALREIARIEARARAIAKSAEEIRAITGTQLRRAQAGLDRAESGLAVEQNKAS